MTDVYPDLCNDELQRKYEALVGGVHTVIKRLEETEWHIRDEWTLADLRALLEEDDGQLNAEIKLVGRISELEAELEGKTCLTTCPVCGSESAKSSELLANRRIRKLEGLRK